MIANLLIRDARAGPAAHDPLMTTMPVRPETLYQGRVTVAAPVLGHANRHGAPTRAMWTDLVFNLVLLLLSDAVFVWPPPRSAT
ncbi:hypothetical protein HBB16_15425 [Pseudonocardia sp. MCCB 268]|nr:hypothetical protein [Pseudonocardia cytotoxica]